MAITRRYAEFLIIREQWSLASTPSLEDGLATLVADTPLTIGASQVGYDASRRIGWFRLGEDASEAEYWDSADQFRRYLARLGLATAPLSD